MLTKKTPTPTEASWQEALARFDDWQRARGMGEKTRRAYGVDLAQLAEWAAGRDLAPHDLSHRELRHFAGVVSERGARRGPGRAARGRVAGARGEPYGPRAPEGTRVEHAGN